MDLAAAQQGEGCECAGAVFVLTAEHAESHQHFVGMEAGVAAMKEGGFGVLYGFDEFLRYELDVVGDACEVFCGVEQEGGTGSEE